VLDGVFAGETDRSEGPAAGSCVRAKDVSPLPIARTTACDCIGLHWTACDRTPSQMTEQECIGQQSTAIHRKPRQTAARIRNNRTLCQGERCFALTLLCAINVSSNGVHWRAEVREFGKGESSFALTTSCANSVSPISVHWHALACIGMHRHALACIGMY